MSVVVKQNRQKISTTVAPDTLAYLEELVAKGEAHTLAEAIDLVTQRLRAADNRERLERDTAAYFEQLSPQALQEESELAAALAASARHIDIDSEP
jgi:hypothetical protein